MRVSISPSAPATALVRPADPTAVLPWPRRRPLWSPQRLAAFIRTARPEADQQLSRRKSLLEPASEGGESCNKERLLVSYSRSPAHQGSTSGFPPPTPVAMAPRQLWVESQATKFPGLLLYFPERLPTPPLPALRRRAHVLSCGLKMLALNWRGRMWVLFSCSLS